MKTQLSADTYDIVVIGAGFAGFYTAQELSRARYKVALLEIGDGLLGKTSSSYNECYKLHTGVHYAGHPQTAIQCLKDSVKFAREFPEYILGYEDDTLPWRHGRHYLMSNSLFDEETIKKTCSLLQKTYAELVQQDPANKVFGEPAHFIRYLKASEYPYVAKTIAQPDMPNENADAHVILGIETPESQINIVKLRRYAEREISHFDQLTFATQHEVKNIQFAPDSLDYQVEAYDWLEGKTNIIRTKGVVNCAWQNIETLDRGLGYYVPDGRLVRLKVSLLVCLPEILRLINTCIFFAGPHCSVTNLGDGTAVITYEPATNVGHYMAGEIPSQADARLADIIGQELRPHEGKGKALADAIMEGAARYIPALKGATVKEVRLGYVKIFTSSKETYTIFDKASPIHRRPEDGVEQKGLCYISHSGMKMTYTRNNAIKVREIMDRHFILRRSLEHLPRVVKRGCA
ncbi:FAD-binding oxidoreductase [Coxiella burnetii]|uniref:FAD dependent oxidoreductase n=2 Tax=Coxiella burnetii TaxID=777 RepID=Q83AW6_COXBU|nr:FAD-dependent oxidoreductase [Coxiella burnetii]NP_820742.1 FAD dependent oxidoreductase [Coxiella burnetii RSA 493]AAO91256.1 FAD dependent oxidoreductase [Coxiella burnetii RSA 493]ARI66521.1 FAD-dependent oxidoreductase [Coxiella burnetii]ARK27963.1 FAD-dependent oxidoreductase [Coxiella burnetii]MCF2094472.1 FAD-dependent oxidoreductase [Coxiella burnetii]MCF2096401.1 FAD-dependent oxidoreductase [Coxiella burnetii]